MTPIEYLNNINIDNWKVENIIEHKELKNSGLPFDNYLKFKIVDYYDISIIDKNILDKKNLTPIQLSEEYYPGIEFWESEGIIVKFVIKNAYYFIAMYKENKLFKNFIKTLQILVKDFFEKTVAI